ncbi:Chitobiase/beta-hexosaminidase C-inal domain containing protein [Leishmania donovani]|uniref:Chitobiase/beta-hexosaminidase C-terminal domain containing protein, putative n=1 Tax=Leishmania donovani TaxID=5661 RepID=A0A3Q8IM61_LEIDO|nr:hypothetical protein, conserved [Leishmania donovani]AYU78997.1 Chitobiase/beta-hexosaminidase C-terminal domain containing protein, putative [Leishmania donovani]TPP50245.1 Chitobiase/beta-hexosaminidase C-terminal domain family protein [Leishmania donovani]TPP51313.1 Chitobiase/beta-hexosaminidase C-terminal domain family protein [Leishmania donovani]CAJ1988988.1 Chitobiase/beta-hexosaminidase C-inal domain containing protein [Leishmania donovani]CBZ34307.1 hypothetical protein, conserved
MTVEHKSIAIAIWVSCAVLLVVAVSLTIFLFLCQRRRRAARLRRRLYLKSFTDGQQRYANNDAWGTEGASSVLNPDALHGSAAAAFYRGFQRYAGEELEAIPSPASASSFPTPLVVYLRVRAAQVYTDACDILLTVDRLRDSLPSDHSSSQILGNDGYYHDDFLLYTAPLEFRVPGLYMIQAHTVRPVDKVVGAVHKFVYVVTGVAPSSGLTPPLPPANPPLLTYAEGSSANNNTSSIDIDIARRQAERAQANGDELQQTAHVSPPAHMQAPSATVEPSADAAGDVPLPPVISPSEGEVTTSTEIVITPHELSTSPDQLRYSLDGSYPTLIYTAPFRLSLPPPSVLPSQRRQVIVQAIAVHAAAAALGDCSAAISACSRPVSGRASVISRAVLLVRPAGLSYFDPRVPTPSMRLRATSATLYFDESDNPPQTQTLYELVFVDEARRKVKFSRQRAQLYDGNPVALTDNVATVHAWTVMSSAAAAEGFNGRAEAAAEDRVRSVPAIYDCSRAATERGKLSRRRIEQYNIRPEQLLPPPVICVSCSEMKLIFDDPPANGRIAYTLNDTEPALFDVSPPACAVPTGDGVGCVKHDGDKGRSRGGKGDDHASPIVGDRDGAHTYIYQPGKHIHVTLMETQQVYVTARVFLPIFEGSDGALYGDRGAQGGSCLGSGRLLGYRYGGVFHRGFYFNSS